jgi:SAM-dependent methyltransferase
MSSSDAARNRAAWDRISEEYQTRHRAFIGRPEPRWGMWQLPESELRVLGDVAEKDVLELGCGAAQWSILLAGRGARVVGLDNSSRQLEYARALMDEAGIDFPLVHASMICWDQETEAFVPRLVADYFGMHRFDDELGEPVEFNLPYGEWIRLFRESGFRVGSLIEIRPPERAESTYRSAADTEWARSWPMEEIWRCVKTG